MRRHSPLRMARSSSGTGRPLWPGMPQDDVAAVKVIEPGQDDVIEAVRASHANAWAPWTDELDEALLEAADSGRSIDQMAETFGRKPNAIIQRLKKVRYG